MKIAAIDPGQKGGIATANGTVITANPIPVAGKEIDIVAIANLLIGFEPDWLVIEKVGAMPKQGVSSTFKFGKGYGALLGIAAALHIPVELVTPQRWKGKVLHGTKKDKDAAIAFCRRAFPQISLIPPRCRVPHDGIADALCLMEYGRRELISNAA